MKKLIVLFAAAAICVSAFAARPTGLNIGGGYAMGFYRSSGDPETPLGAFTLLDDQNYYGAYVEVGYDIKVAKHSKVYFGARFDELLTGEFSSSSRSSAYSAYVGDRTYLDIPVKYQFSGKIAPNTRLFFTVGPTVNVWLVNAAVYTMGSASSVDSKITERVDYFRQYPDVYNRMNLSLGGSFGVITHHVKIYAAYDQAVCNSAKGNSSNKYSVSFGQLRVGAAYVF